MNELLRSVNTEPDKNEEYSVRMLQTFGTPDPYLTPDKVRELWVECSKHDTLFSDYTRGNVESFLEVLFSPNAIVAEIYSLTQELPVGMLMLSDIIPRFDAYGHITFWDSDVRGRELMVKVMMNLWMTEFDLHRLSARIPVHQQGTIRMTKRLGFREEGVIREGNLHKGQWVDLLHFGILLSELKEKINE